MKKIIAITQVRLGSRRLPGKILKKIGKETALSLHLKRILKSKRLTSVVVATTFEQDIQSVINICNEKDVP